MSPGAKAREQQVKAEVLWVQSDSFVCRTYVRLCRKHPNMLGHPCILELALDLQVKIRLGM